MDVEELKIKISASFEGFQGAMNKIKLQLEDLDKTTDKLNRKSGKAYKPKINTDSLKKEMNDTTDKVNKKTEEMVNKIKSETSKMIKILKKNMEKLSDITVKGIGNFKVPNIGQKGDSLPKTSGVLTKNTSRGPPSLELEDLTNAKLGKIQELDTTDRQIDNLRKKLKLLNDQLKNTFNKEGRNKLEATILSTESRMNSLINKSEKLGREIIDLDSKINSLGKSKGMNNLTDSTKKTNNALKSNSSAIGMIVKSMFTWSIVMPTILKGLSAMSTGLYNNLMANKQFSNSLAQIRSNLMIAFTPIYEAVLPAINALMSALSIATQYIASFISAIFGKTFNQSKQATQGLIDAKAAMGAYGDSAKEAGKKAKDALGLAGIDEINTLNSNDSSSGSGGSGGGSGIPQLVTPALDTSSVDSAMQNLVDKIKTYFSTFNFEPLIQSFDRLKKSVEPIVNNLGKIIKWFLTDILDPLAHWTISDLLPAFINLVAGALDFLNPILEVFMDAGKWLWDSFLQPIASWTGGVIVDILNGLAGALSKIGDWINRHKETLGKIVKFVASVVAVLGILKLAIWGVGIVIGILSSPITLIIAGIVALIAIFTQLYDSCEGFREFVDTVVEFGKNLILGLLKGIVSIMSTIGRWLKDHVVDPILNAIKSFFGIHSPSTVFAAIGVFLMEGLLKGIESLKEKIINFFSNFCTNLKNVFTDIPKWFGDKFVEAKNAIIEKFSPIGKFFTDLFSNIKNIFSNIGTAISNAVSGAFRKAINGVLSFAANTINGFIRSINGAIGLINKIPGVNISRINTLHVPMLAKGGIIDSPTLAMIGEAGKEAVVPLENNKGGLRELASLLLAEMGPRNYNNDSFGDGDLILQIDGSVIGKVALKQLRKMQRQGNITLIPI